MKAPSPFHHPTLLNLITTTLLSASLTLALPTTSTSTATAPALAPQSLTIQSTQIREADCTYAISTRVSPSNTSIDIIFDTSASTGTTPDALAWTDSMNSRGSVCTVCTTFKWKDDKTQLYGLITSLGYDFWHRLDPGLLEQVESHIRRERDNGEEWFETSYIYGGTESNITHRVTTTVPMASEPLVLDFSKDSETVCVETYFAVYNRIGVQGATGEISRKSVFTQSMNIDWQTEKPMFPSPPARR